MDKISESQKEIINKAYNAIMDHKATPEQALIWRFANSFNCLKVWNKYSDNEHKKGIIDIIEDNSSM